MFSWWHRGVSLEGKKEVVQSGTHVELSERVRFIWASNKASAIVLRSVKSQCSAQPVTEDAEEANKQSSVESMRDSFHM